MRRNSLEQLRLEANSCVSEGTGFARYEVKRDCATRKRIERSFNQGIVSDFDHEDVEELRRRGHAARVAILDMPLRKELRDAVISAYEQLCQRLGREPELAVRSSATAEDLPEASFAGAAETFLNVRGDPDGVDNRRGGSKTRSICGVKTARDMNERT